MKDDSAIERIVSIDGAHETNFFNSRVKRVLLFRPSFYLPRGFSAFFQNLEKYETAGCGLKEISRADFSDLSKLTLLYAERNELTEIPDDTFRDLTMLTDLSLIANIKCFKLATFAPHQSTGFRTIF